MWLFQMSRWRRSGARRQSQVLAVPYGISFRNAGKPRGKVNSSGAHTPSHAPPKLHGGSLTLTVYPRWQNRPTWAPARRRWDTSRHWPARFFENIRLVDQSVHFCAAVVHHSKFGSAMSQMGLVSRVAPVHTAMRNCTRDEGWPGIRHVGGAKLNLALVWNVRTWPAMLREKAQAAPTARLKVPMRRRGADCPVVVKKRGNARGAKGVGHRC